MNPREALALVTGVRDYNMGAFYGAVSNAALGAGKLFNGVKFPQYYQENGLFRTVRGPVIVLTHECDVDPENGRIFSEDVLICPISPLDIFLQYLNDQGHANIRGFLTGIARREVYRFMYIPPLGPLKFGGILNLNRISSTHVEAFRAPIVQELGVVSAWGLREIDSAMHNHLFREKSDRLRGM